MEGQTSRAPLNPEGTSPAFSEIVQDLEQAVILKANFEEASRLLDEAKTQRDAELAQVNARWEGPLADMRDRLLSAYQPLTELWCATREKAFEGQIADDELVYVHGLLAIEEGGGRRFDFDRAEHNLERFRRLQPGTRVLGVGCSGFDSIGAPDARIRDLGIGDGGILAEPARVNIYGSSGPWDLRPQLSLTFSNGEQTTEDWNHKRAIGDEEVNKVVSIWIEEHREILFDEYAPGDSRTIAAVSTLSSLAPLQIELPEKTEFQARALNKFRDNVLAYPSSELVGALHHTARIDREFYQSTLEQLVSDPKFMDWNTLEQSVVKVIEPAIDSVPELSRRLAQAKAAQLVAQMRIAVAIEE